MDSAGVEWLYGDGLEHRRPSSEPEIRELVHLLSTSPGTEHSATSRVGDVLAWLRGGDG